MLYRYSFWVSCTPFIWRIFCFICFERLVLNSFWATCAKFILSILCYLFYLVLQGGQKKWLAECCWSPKILTKIKCCGAKFLYGKDLGALDPARVLATGDWAGAPLLEQHSESHFFGTPCVFILRNIVLYSFLCFNSADAIQGGITWQPFARGKNGHENFRQARIYNFRDKCVVFARNLKFSNLTQ